MSSEKPTADKRPESPTTARELDFDDDDAPATASHSLKNSNSKSHSQPQTHVRFDDEATEIPPPKPPRPTDGQAQAHKTLAEAFPDMDSAVIKAVLVASSGRVEPAFHALLSMSDPSFSAEEPPPPPQPPRPQPHSQLEQDERYARQLAEHYQAQAGQRQRQRQEVAGQRHARQPYNSQPDREHSFFDDDLPEIRKNIEQGFKETQKTVTSWITTLTKKLDGEPDHYDQYGNPTRPGQSNPDPRRSADHTRYDADNRVLGDDFAHLTMRDDTHPHPQRQASRSPANPNLFKPTPVAPPLSAPVDEVDALYRDPSPIHHSARTGGGGGGSSNKWQPLTSVAPHPEPDDHDPFSLGDSDDEDAAKTKDINPDATERLKLAAQAKDAPVTIAALKPAETSGSVGQQDATAEALLKEAK